MTFSISRKVSIILLVAVSLLLYGVHVRNSFLDLDDQTFIFKNPLILEGSFFAAFSQFSNLLYVPLTVLSWQITHVIFGMNSWAFHGTDLIIHCANVILAFLLFEKLAENRLAAFLAALVFAIHPLNSEAVYWASQRKDLLSTFLALGSIHTYIKYLEHENTRWIIYSCVAFALALFAKIGVFTLPVLFLTLDWVTGRKMTTRVFVEKIPFFALSAIFIIIGSFGGQQFLGTIGITNILLLAVKGTAYILLHMIFPWTQNVFLYERAEPVITNPTIMISVAASVLLLIVTVTAVIRRRNPLIAAGLAWFCITLAPTFTAAQKAGLLFYTAEKYAYLPMIGLLIAALGLILVITEKYPRSSHLLGICTILWVGIFAVRTHVYGYAWKDTVTLYNHVLTVEPDNPIALTGLGFIEGQKGDWTKALEYHTRSLKADPENLMVYINTAGAYRSLGKTRELVETFRSMLPHITRRQLLGDPSVQQILEYAGTQVLPAYDQELGKELLRKVKELTTAS